jgi:FkbM family methyltransferase
MILSRLTGGAPVMGSSLLELRRLCPGLLAYMRLVIVYFTLLRDGRPGRPRPITSRRLRLKLLGAPHDWWVADAGEIGALWEVFIAGQYATWAPPDAQLVVDVGANVGTATAWLRRRYPRARIVAVEPNPGAVARLRRNMARDPRVEVVEAALSDHDGVAHFEQGAWTMRGQLVDEGGLEVRALTLRTLRERLDGARIDLLKLDTEGGEWRVLGESLADVGTVALEIHEPTPDGRAPDAILDDVAEREGLELRSGASASIRWLLQGRPDRQRRVASELHAG